MSIPTKPITEGKGEVGINELLCAVPTSRGLIDRIDRLEHAGGLERLFAIESDTGISELCSAHVGEQRIDVTFRSGEYDDVVVALESGGFNLTVVADRAHPDEPCNVYFGLSPELGMQDMPGSPILLFRSTKDSPSEFTLPDSIQVPPTWVEATLRPLLSTVISI